MVAGLKELELVEVASVATKGNGRRPQVEITDEYQVAVTVVGTTPMLFHRWDTAAVTSKGKAAKNSAEKKTDNVESYVYRDDRGNIGIPGVNFKACLVSAGRRVQDPSSPRKSAMDLIKAGIQVEPLIASIGKKDWDYLDDRRVVIQRSAVNRRRPALKEGWSTTFTIVVMAPEYISPDFLHELVTRAGRFVGLLDFRPDYGRFRIDRFEVKTLG